MPPLPTDWYNSNDIVIISGGEAYVWRGAPDPFPFDAFRMPTQLDLTDADRDFLRVQGIKPE